MIRIHKHNISPASLSRRSSWNEDDIVEQLKNDQFGKCYLCERTQITDFEVEHFRSRKNFPELSYEWTNLFWGCSYCNGKKSSSFDNILNPIENNIEDLIYQSLDFPNAKAIFRILSKPSIEAESTTILLEKVFNGTGKIRTIREQSFYDYVVSRITSFQEMTLSWLKAPAIEIEAAIIEELDVKLEFLGFKYWIIKSNKILSDTFGKYTKWQKGDD